MRSGPLDAITVAAPVRVRERLARAPDGPRPVLHASASAIYVDLDGGCLGLVSATATRVPCALWSTLPESSVQDLAALPSTTAEVVGGSLVLDGRPVRITRLVDVGAPHPRRREAARSDAVTRTASQLGLPPDGRLTARDVAGLVGRGPGLTPLGDDVLAGWLATRAAAGAPVAAVVDAVRRRLHETTMLSATLLDCALRGEVLPELGDWLAGTGSTRSLLGVGATSGAGLLTGASLALASLEGGLTRTNDPLDRPQPGKVA